MLTKKEFNTALCANCVLCPGAEATENSFCYNRYLECPTSFVQESYQVLRSILSWPILFSEEEALFEKIFCTKGCPTQKKNQCYVSTTAFMNCLDSFVDSMYKTNKKTVSPKEKEITFIFGGKKNWVDKLMGANAS